MSTPTLWRMHVEPIPPQGYGIAVGGVTISIGVSPPALGHRVGVVWTPLRWFETIWTEARWQRNVPGAFGGTDELWKADLHFQSKTPVTFWYALYLTDTHGDWYWDNNDGWNHETRIP